MKHQRHRPPSHSRAALLARSTSAIRQLREAARDITEELGQALQRTTPAQTPSAQNLLHYLGVLRHDIRHMRRDLSLILLSSLLSMEAHTMASLAAVLEALLVLRGKPVPEELTRPPAITFQKGDALLTDHANGILGVTPSARRTRIMVTMPSEAADHPAIVRNLLKQGMHIMRINCAHDGPDAWAKMIEHLRKAEAKVGRQCKVSFDLAGPKLRTGEIEPGAKVTKLRPPKNVLGQVVAPALVRLGDAKLAGEVQTPSIPVYGDLLANAKVDALAELVDARDRRRTLRVAEVSKSACQCEADRTAYIVPGTRLRLRRKRKLVGKATVGDLPASDGAIVLAPGDLLDVLRGEAPGRGPVVDEKGQLVEPARVSCSVPEVFNSVRARHRIFFDDGKIAGVIRSVSDERLRVEIVNAAGGAAKLHGEKGINLPDGELKLSALTAKDRDDLEFVCRHADMVALSFVQRPEDVDELIAELKQHDASQLGIVLKIETQLAFRRLPDILLRAMQHSPLAVMVARGDLGVEVGFERLSEVQEEILWLCEAAHVPVIWATQVLESLAQGGMPSRAELTDAAMGGRAECVMLNKGPYILQTLSFLRDVLSRMEAHQDKKMAMMRRLSVSKVEPAAKKH